ncbi:MAG: hypothetical protein KH972_07360 [Peptostreptococcaceae bacterium]|nr:hypothetical protein [Peptostreptococcaceae bacterium]
MNIVEIQARKDVAKKHYEAWLEAEIAVSSSQSYTIGSRSLTRANLSEIRQQLDYWNKQLEKLTALEQHGGRNRSYRAVPRDL